MGYYSALKRNEILANDTTGMNSEDIMLNKINQLYNANTVYLNLYEVCSLDNFIKKERRMVVDRGLRRGREMWSYCLVDREFQFHSMKRILEMDDGAQQCEFTCYMKCTFKNYCIIHTMLCFATI